MTKCIDKSKKEGGILCFSRSSVAVLEDRLVLALFPLLPTWTVILRVNSTKHGKYFLKTKSRPAGNIFQKQFFAGRIFTSLPF